MNTFLEWFGGNIFKSVLSTLALLITVMSLVLVWYRKRVTRENLKTIGTAFRDTVAGLSSPSLEVRMSSAILLRRFLDDKSEYGVGGTPFAKVTVSVVAAVLKSLQTSDFQKALADTLRFAPPGYLQGADFQRANLSKAFLGGNHVNMAGADFFQANLAGALLKEAVLDGAQFYEASLHDTRFNGAQLRGANFSYAVLYKVNFRKADLTGASFDNARLREVDFTGAKVEGTHGVNVVGCGNIAGPAWIKPFQRSDRASKGVFVSRLGVLDARQRIFVDGVRDVVTNAGFACIELSRDMYDASNVLSNLSRRIDACSAMIVFGFKSIHVVDGVFRYSTEDSRRVSNEFLSTPWNHIEVGMAVMRRIPVLLIVDEGINDGAFHTNINDELLVKLPVGCCLDGRNRDVQTWLDSIIPPDRSMTPVAALQNPTTP